MHDNGAKFWRWVAATLVALLVMLVVGFGTTWTVFMQDAVTHEEVKRAISEHGPYTEDRKMIVSTLDRVQQAMDRHDLILQELARGLQANTQLIQSNTQLVDRLRAEIDWVSKNR